MTKIEKITALFKELLGKVSRDNVSRYMRNHHPDEYAVLMKLTAALDKFGREGKNGKISIFERIRFIELGLSDRPKCRKCGVRYVNGFDRTKNEYRKWCSAACQASDPDCVERSKRAREKKYGDPNFNNVGKSRSTRAAKNGGKWHAADFHEKTTAGRIAKGRAANWVNVELARKTKLERWGSANFNNKEKNRLTRRTNFYRILSEDGKTKPLFSLEEYLAGNAKTTFRWKCLGCGTEFESKFNYNFKCLKEPERRVRCLKCFPYEETKKSAAEKELFEFVRTFDPGCVESDRTTIAPYELDVYCPSKKLAFEYDGMYWHSDEVKDRDYHLFKTEKCAERGVRLIHVFENEWKTERKAVESRIRNLFGDGERTVYARNCEIAPVDAKTAREFLNENHLQKSVNSKTRLGLYSDGELVSLMTFGKPRFSKKHEWELLRFCSRLNCRVLGAAGKLLRRFEKTFRPKSLVSYADRRWSSGDLYAKLGFRFTGNSSPNYWYFRPDLDALISRVRCQKHKLAGFLENFDPEKTEYENMKANGYYRIYDCGNAVFEKVYEKDPE